MNQATNQGVRVVALPPAPCLPEDDAAQNHVNNLLPLTGMLGSVAMVAGASGTGARALLMGAAVLVSTLALVAAQVVRQRLQHERAVHRARAEHLHRLRELSTDLLERADRSRQELTTRWPGVDRPGPPPETLTVRIGTATVPADVRFETGRPAPGVVDPVCRDALARFPAAHSDLRGAPLLVRLDTWRHLRIHAPAAELAEAAARTLLLQAARSHANSLAFAVLCAPTEAARWDWAKWLPQHAAGRVHVDHRPAHLLARTPTNGHLLLVISPEWLQANDPPAEHELPTSVTVLHLADAITAVAAPDETLTIRLGDPRSNAGTCPATLTPAPPETRDVRVELLPLARACAAARRLGRSRVEDGTSSPISVQQLARTPRRLRGQELLRVPIGTDSDERPLHLDLKEAARGGNGPHGLLVGATGSGKSELLRTLVTSLVSSHHPEDLALVLVDFKGGATFSEVADLPHVAACVTNLSDDVGLVDRMQDALGGELERRQEVLHASGHPSVDAHRVARESDPTLEPMPYLFVCVDEFSELLTARPEFVELFTAIGRLGRSLGVHLLLASQRLDDGRLHALEAHLSYRIALRTFSAQESRAAIGTPEAHTLPRRPGVGLFRTGAEPPVRFDVLHVGAPAGSDHTGSTSGATGSGPAIFTVGAGGRRPQTGRLQVRPIPDQHPAPSPPTLAQSLLHRTRQHLRGTTPTRRIWLPPLDGTVPLASLLGPLARDRTLGLHAPALRGPASLHPPIGLVDLPRLQRRDLLRLDLSGAGGHVAVVGAPRSGRSTALSTLVCALTLARTPQELTLHLVDLAGGALVALDGLPHTASLSTRERPELLERVVDQLESTVADREGVGICPDDPEVFLVVDGWGTLREEHEDLERRLAALAPRALAVRVHVVLSALRWNELRPALLDAVASRVELRLGDTFDSVVHRTAAAAVPLGRPGRGIVAEGRTVLVATPTLTPGPPGYSDHPKHLASAVAAIDAAWTGARPARLRELPARVDLVDLTTTGGQLRLALDERGVTRTLSPAEHLVVTGPAGAGRTTTLRTNVDEWLGRVPDGQVVLLDPRGSLEALVPEENLLAHTSGVSEAASLLRELVAALGRRLEQSTVPSSGDRTTDGPSAAPLPVTVVIDDLDLWRDLGLDLTTLTPLLPRAEAIGLRTVVACRDAGPLRSVDRWVELLTSLGATRLDLVGTTPGRGRLRRGPSSWGQVQVAVDLDAVGREATRCTPERRRSA